MNILFPSPRCMPPFFYALGLRGVGFSLLIFAFVPFAIKAETVSLMDEPSSLEEGSLMLDQSIADVDGKILLFSDFDNARKRIVLQNEIFGVPQDDALLNERAFNQLVSETIELEYASRVGFNFEGFEVPPGYIQNIAASLDTTPELLRENLNAIMPHGYELFYEGARREYFSFVLRGAASIDPVSREEVDAVIHELDQAQRINAVYVLNYAEGSPLSEASLAELFSIYRQSIESGTVQNSETQDYRVLAFVGVSEDALPSLIRENMPTEVGMRASFEDESGAHTLMLLSKGEKESVRFYERSRIFLPKPSWDKEEAQALFDRIASLHRAGTPFWALARTYSEDYATNLQGGAMVRISNLELGSSAAFFDDLALGVISSMRETPRGYEVFMLTKREAGYETPTMRRLRIQRRLEESRINFAAFQWLNRLYSSALVTIFAPDLIREAP